MNGRGRERGRRALACTMGLSRVYLGHHWLTDVLVAWTLGAAWPTVVVLAHRLFFTMSKAEPRERRATGRTIAARRGRPRTCERALGRGREAVQRVRL